MLKTARIVHIRMYIFAKNWTAGIMVFSIFISDLQIGVRGRLWVRVSSSEHAHFERFRACSEHKTRTRSRPRTAIWRSLLACRAQTQSVHIPVVPNMVKERFSNKASSKYFCSSEKTWPKKNVLAGIKSTCRYIYIYIYIFNNYSLR